MRRQSPLRLLSGYQIIGVSHTKPLLDEVNIPIQST